MHCGTGSNSLVIPHRELLISAPAGRAQRERRQEARPLALLAAGAGAAGPRPLRCCSSCSSSLLQLGAAASPKRHARPSSRWCCAGCRREQWAQNRGRAREQQRRAEPPRQREKKKEEKKPEEKSPRARSWRRRAGQRRGRPEREVRRRDLEQDREEGDAAKRPDRVLPERDAQADVDEPARRATAPDSVEKAQVAGNNGIGRRRSAAARGRRRSRSIEVPDVEEALRRSRCTRPTSEAPARTSRTAARPRRSRATRTGSRFSPAARTTEKTLSQGRAGIAGRREPAAVGRRCSTRSPAPRRTITSRRRRGRRHVPQHQGVEVRLFFNRVKQSVGQQWNPGAAAAAARSRPATSTAGATATRCSRVTLDEQRHGARTIYVEKSCGLDFLDLEAVQSFERAQPFPNPPPGLVQADSLGAVPVRLLPRDERPPAHAAVP